MTNSITWILTELEKAVEKFREQNTDTEENKGNYFYWRDQVQFLEKQLEQEKECNQLFEDLQVIEERIGKLHRTEKELWGVTPARVAFREAHEHVQQAKTAIAFAHTGD